MQEVLLVKQQQTSEECLKFYYELGNNLEVKPLSRRAIRRCYFNWLKNDNDTRDFRQVFNEKLNTHNEKAKKELEKFKKLSSQKKIGLVKYDKNTGTCTITSRLHRPLKIYNLKNYTRLRENVKDYLKDYYSYLDFSELKEKGSSPIRIRVAKCA